MNTIPVVQESRSPILAGLKASLVTGAAGFLVGGTLGIAKSKPAIVLWTLVSTIQWGLLGGTYWGIRTALIQPLPDEARNPQRLLFYSSLSGGLSFAVVGAVTRGRRNVIPGTVMGSILGFSGQGIYNFLDNRHTLAATSPAPTTSLWQKIVSAKWSPITPLSDEQYIEHLNKKLLRIEVEIAVINDEIAELEEQKDLKKDISQLRAEKIDKA